MEYKEIYKKKLSFKYKVKKLASVVLIVGGLFAVAAWTLAQQEGLMVGKVLSGTAGQELGGKKK